MLKLFKIVSFCLIIQSIPAIGQISVNKYPVRFSQYYTNYSVINPSAAGCYGKYNLTAGNKRLLGNLSKIATYYAAGSMRLGIKKNSSASFSSIGFHLYNDREGQYLQRTRAYLMYAWNAQLTRQVRFSGGFKVGAMNYNVRGTELSGSGSDLAPDGSIGIRFYTEKFHLGTSYNQVFNSKIQPLEEVAELSPFVNFSGSYLFTLAEKLIFQPTSVVRLLIADHDYEADVNLNFNYNQKIFFSSGIHGNDMLVHTVGLTNILEAEGGFNLYFTYGYFYHKTGLSVNFAELTISYLLKN